MLRSAMRTPSADGYIAAAAGGTRPPPPATQLSSPTLLSPPVNSEGDGYLLVAESRAHRMMPSSRVIPHPTSVGVPVNTVNAYEVLSAVSSVMSTDQKGDSSPTPPPADTIGVIAPMAFTSLQALLDNSYETYFGNGDALVTEGTPLRMKELFESGARVID